MNDEGARRNLGAIAPRAEQRASKYVPKPEQKWEFYGS